ncbi:MAG: DUF1413 domain-containing protein [Clostridium perfringens]
MKSLLNRAINEVNNLENNEEFLLKELFKGYEWNRLNRNIRLKLGTLFLYEVENDPSLEIEIVAKNSSNQQKYKKR